MTKFLAISAAITLSLLTACSDPSAEIKTPAATVAAPAVTATATSAARAVISTEGTMGARGTSRSAEKGFETPRRFVVRLVIRRGAFTGPGTSTRFKISSMTSAARSAAAASWTMMTSTRVLATNRWVTSKRASATISTRWLPTSIHFKRPVVARSAVQTVR